jgi:hypothetical protein
MVSPPFQIFSPCHDVSAIFILFHYAFGHDSSFLIVNNCPSLQLAPPKRPVFGPVPTLFAARPRRHNRPKDLHGFGGAWIELQSINSRLLRKW